MKNKKNVPDIRFKGFAEEWEEQTFRDVAKISSAARVHKNEWTNCGVPFFRSSDVISAYKGDNNQKAYISFDLYNTLVQRSGKLDKDDILITGGGTIGIPYIILDNNPIYSKDADLIWIKLKKNLNSNFAYYYFFSKALRKYISSISHIGTIAHYTIEQVQSTPITKPSFNEQQAIGDYFKNIDRLINTSQTKLDKLKNIKKACLEKMFSRNDSTTPELRFKGFSEEWKHIYLKEIGNWDKGFGLPKADLDKEGLYPCIHYGELFAYSEIIKSIASYTNIKSDKTTSNNDILFPDSDVTPDGLGRCSAIEIPNVILGGGINVLKLYKDFKAPYISLNVNNNRKQIIERVTGTTVRHIHSKDLNDIELFVSKNLIEQQKIGDCFEKLDILITKTEQQINKLKNIKKACLDKMFVNTKDKI